MEIAYILNKDLIKCPAGSVFRRSYGSNYFYFNSALDEDIINNKIIQYQLKPSDVENNKEWFTIFGGEFKKNENNNDSDDYKVYLENQNKWINVTKLTMVGDNSTQFTIVKKTLYKTRLNNFVLSTYNPFVCGKEAWKFTIATEEELKYFIPNYNPENEY